MNRFTTLAAMIEDTVPVMMLVQCLERQFKEEFKSNRANALRLAAEATLSHLTPLEIDKLLAKPQRSEGEKALQDAARAFKNE